MKVKMLVSISGTRNGDDWPPAGGEIDLPDNEAIDLLNARLAAPVEVAVETADAPSPRRRSS